MKPKGRTFNFPDRVNPTDAELEEWAYAVDLPYPPIEQDWDLIVTRISRGALLLKLASDATCPRQNFFLRCLYLLIGDSVRTKFNIFFPRSAIEDLLVVASESQDKAVLQWVERSRFLIAHPETFNYEDWCGGRLGREARKSSAEE